MRHIGSVIAIALIISVFCCHAMASSVGPIKDETTLQMYEHSASHLGTFSTILGHDVLMEQNYGACRLPADVVHVLSEVDYQNPKYVTILMPTAPFSMIDELTSLGIHPDMGATVALQMIFEANAVYSDKTFAIWSDYMSCYDCFLTDDASWPPVAYAVLLYGKDLPQIVTVFFRNDGSVITKTSVVYNPKLLETGIDDPFTYIALSCWQNMEATTYTVE